MRILVTGGAGYVGSVVGRDLWRHGHEVRVLDSLLRGSQGLLGLVSEERFCFMRGDIRSGPIVQKALEGIEAVVHLAAIVGDPACAREPVLGREINEEASLQLFDLSRRAGVKRFLFASTCSNYGRMSDPAQYLTEDSELKPLSVYAETKVAVERALLNGNPTPGPAVCILRLATAFGISPRMRFDLTVNEFTMELLTKRKVTVYGEQFWRPYVHVQDAARAVRLVLESPVSKIDHQAFNVGDTRENYRKGDLVELIRKQVGEPSQIERVVQADDPRDYRVSFEKIKRELRFFITRPVESGIREIQEAISQGIFTDLDSPLYRNS